MQDVAQSETNQTIHQSSVVADGDETLLTHLPYDRQWLGSILRPALIAVMIACLDLAVLSLMIRFNPALANGYAQVIVSLSILAALFACAATAWLSQPERRQWRQPIFRLAEFCFVIIMARLLTWLTMGGFPSIESLLYRPLEALLDGSFLFGAIVIGLSWLLASLMTDDLLRLALQPDEIFAIENDRIGELIRTSNSDRPAILQRIVARWVGGGVILVLIAASVRLDRPENGFFAITRQNIDPTVIAAVVIYFLAGLLLISQGQLAILRTRWLIDRVPASEQVLGRWPIYVTGLLLLIGVLAALLPFGGTFLLAQILYGIVTLFLNTIFAVFRTIMGLLLLLVAAFAGDAPPEEAPEAPPPAPPPSFEELLPAANQMPAWAGGALFWVVMAIFLSYAAYIYLTDKGIRFTWLAAFWALLQARWRELFGAYQEWQQTRLRGSADEDELPAEARRKLFQRRRDWRRLDPTARTRYLYLAMLEEAKASGIGRTEGETPFQYAPRLGHHMGRSTSDVAAAGDGEAIVEPIEPIAKDTIEEESQTAQVKAQRSGETDRARADADTSEITELESEYVADVATMTAAFVRTRYANDQVTEPEASQLEQLWEKLNRRLRRTT